MDNQNQKLALIYANCKLAEYQIEKRNAPLCGNVDMSTDEIDYLQKAYNFATDNLPKTNLS